MSHASQSSVLRREVCFHFVPCPEPAFSAPGTSLLASQLGPCDVRSTVSHMLVPCRRRHYQGHDKNESAHTKSGIIAKRCMLLLSRVD